MLKESKKRTIENIETNGFEEYDIETEEEWKVIKNEILDICIECIKKLNL